MSTLVHAFRLCARDSRQFSCDFLSRRRVNVCVSQGCLVLKRTLCECNSVTHVSSNSLLCRFANRSERRQTDFLLNSERMTSVRLFATSSSYSFYKALCHQSSKTKKNSRAIASTELLTERKETLLWQRYIYVQTSTTRWEDVPGGVLFDVGYLDSKPGVEINPSVPLVVFLHSSPGSFYDMQPVMEAFVKAGCRVLAPGFPGLGYTQGVTKEFDDVFMHTTSEKAEFVRDFLTNLNIQKVDLLVGQGSGCYPAMQLVTTGDTSDVYKSVALLSPWPHQHFKGTSQKKLLPFVHDLWERPFYRGLAKALSRFIPNTANAKAQERITTTYTLYNINFSEIGGFGMALDINKIPRLMMFAEDDSLVEAALSYEMAGIMGISPDSIHRFKGRLDREMLDKFPSCLVFDKGGQHIELTHSGVINAVLFSLLKSVHPGFRPF